MRIHALLVLVALAAAPARAQEVASVTSDALLPHDPFAGAAEGDWSLYAARRTATRGGRLLRAEKGNLLYERVDLADEDVVLRLHEEWQRLDFDDPTLFEQMDTSAGVMSVVVGRRGRPPSVREFLRHELGETLFARGVCTDVRVTEEDYRTAQGPEFAGPPGHAFACRRVAVRLAAGGRAADIVVWLAPEVKGLGLVAIRLALDEVTLDLELWGYGAGDATTFGQPKEFVRFRH